MTADLHDALHVPFLVSVSLQLLYCFVGEREQKLNVRMSRIWSVNLLVRTFIFRAQRNPHCGLKKPSLQQRI